ncbi:hypothetical protein [Mycobacterium sp. URHB0021]
MGLFVGAGSAGADSITDAMDQGICDMFDEGADTATVVDVLYRGYKGVISGLGDESSRDTPGATTSKGLLPRHAPATCRR